MAGKLGLYQMGEFRSWGGLTTKEMLKTYLGTELEKDPQWATDQMIQIMAANHGAYLLEAFLSKFGTKKFKDDDFFYWKIIADAEKSIPLVEARDENGNVITPSTNKMVGAGTVPFYLVFATRYFFNGEVIGGNLNEVYPMKVIGEGVEEGSNYVYKVELMGGNTNGIPSERLLAGEKFTYDYAPTSRRFDRSKGGLRYGSSSAMRNSFSEIRLWDKQDDITGDTGFVIGYPCITGYQNGKPTYEVKKRWIDVVKWTFEKTWSEYKNKCMAYSVSNETESGEVRNWDNNGEVIRVGSGLFEQLDSAGVISYTDFSLEQLSDEILKLVTNVTSYGDRVYVMRTGTGGFMQFSKAVSNMAEGHGWSKASAQNPATIQKVNSEYHKNSLGYGYQFAEYYGPMGIVLKCEIDPMYDDRTREGKILWKNGLPAKSFRYDIWDLGNSNEQNIFKAEVTSKPEMRGYTSGPFRNVFTDERNIRYASTDEAGSSQHIRATLGVGVLDATRTLAYVPSVLIA